MTNKVARLKPANRHILIVPHTHKHEQQSNVLLPEGFLEEEDYVEATVVDVADDCKSQFKALKYGNLSENRVLVDKKMIQEIRNQLQEMLGKKYTISDDKILEIFLKILLNLL